MSAWERWAKRLWKGLLWTLGYIIGCVSIGIEPRWQLALFCVGLVIWSDLLDYFWPTIETHSEGHKP